MGKVYSLVFRPFRNFNLESRAHKLISQNKPRPAPRHKADQVDVDRMIKEYPKEFEESLKKNENLDKYLKNVFVTSTDPDSTKTAAKEQDSQRPLPENRHLVEDFEYGFKEPEKVPLGKVTLKNALQFLTNHEIDAKTHSPANIAGEYSLPEETVKNILKYFKVYEVYVPANQKVKAKFAGPSRPRVRLVVNEPKSISAGKSEEKT